MTKILAINGGSSTIRFGVFEDSDSPALTMRGKVERIGLSGTQLTVTGPTGNRLANREIDASDHRAAMGHLLAWLDSQSICDTFTAVGHRIVHGMTHTEPQLLTPQLLQELQRIMPFDPEHLPRELDLIAAIRRRFAHLPQIACFDTAFHRDMPQKAKLLPIPRRYAAMGVARYGFHGLSYSFLLEQLRSLEPAAAQGRVILAHLGNGASLAAVLHGKSIDTSMGFTPTSGLMMSTRSGDLDPGLAFYLERTEKMTSAQFQHMVNHESGLLGVSQISSDMRDLLVHESTDVRATEAVALFCYQVKKCIGSFAAALGGLDTLVFAGGIGEHSPLIRERICEDLGFLGIALDRARNAIDASLISADTGPVAVHVMRTDEELMIARSVRRVVALTGISRTF